MAACEPVKNPVGSWRDHGLDVALWFREFTNGTTGEKFPSFKITIKENYWDKNNDCWASTKSISGGKLPYLIPMLQDAYREIKRIREIYVQQSRAALGPAPHNSKSDPNPPLSLPEWQNPSLMSNLSPGPHAQNYYKDC